MPAKDQSKTSLFLKICIGLFAVLVPIIFVGRNNFFFGTGLIVFRWLFVLLGLLFVYLLRKRENARRLRQFLLLLVFLLTAEFAWNTLNEKRLEQVSPESSLSLMTYNLFFQNKDPHSVIGAIKKHDPDLLVVQELTPRWETQLVNALATDYPYHQTFPNKGVFGLAVFSKYPISESEILKDYYARAFAQVFVLTVGEKKVQVFNVHLASPAIAVEKAEHFLRLFNSVYKERRFQLKQINQKAAKNEKNFDAQLMMGDLNTVRIEPIYRKLKTDWVNLHNVAGEGLGLNFPNTHKMDPVLTLDYIFLRGKVKGEEMKVVPGGSSDHLGLVGVIAL